MYCSRAMGRRSASPTIERARTSGETSSNAGSDASIETDVRRLITLTQQPGRLQLVVTDNGQGLPHDFDPKTDLGLGLTIVQTSITEDMRGTFQIGPALSGPGTTVQITIPLK